MSRVVRRAGTGAAAATAAHRALQARPPGGEGRWRRTNFRGEPVSLLSGPALAVAAALSSRRPGPALVAGLGAAAVGAYDDAVGDQDAAKGFRGHAGALAQGRLTAGGVKVLGISAAGLVAAACLRPRSRADLLVSGAVVAATANLVNLLDLRPGRALKAGLAAAALAGEPGVAGSCAALLPDDLRERTMLGDSGANALGAVLGVAVLARLRSLPARILVLGGLGWLTAASERVSFSAVIDQTPWLRAVDQLGRRR